MYEEIAADFHRLNSAVCGGVTGVFSSQGDCYTPIDAELYKVWYSGRDSIYNSDLISVIRFAPTYAPAFSHQILLSALYNIILREKYNNKVFSPNNSTVLGTHALDT